MQNENLYDEYFKKYAAKHNLDWLFLKAQVKQESAFNPKAENKFSHAKGLSQFMDATWLEWEDETPGIQNEYRDYNPLNPEDSIRVQAAYMDYLRKRLLKNLQDARNINEWMLAAYNWGIGYLLGYRKHGQYREGLLKISSDNFERALPSMPKETQNYIHNIMNYYKVYSEV